MKGKPLERHLRALKETNSEGRYSDLVWDAYKADQKFNKVIERSMQVFGTVWFVLFGWLAYIN